MPSAEFKSFCLVTDSACDLPDETQKALDIKVIPFYVAFDDGVYLKEGEGLNPEAFYEKMSASPGIFPKTSLPSVDDYASVFIQCAAAGEAVICICLSSELSGSYNSARNAAELVKETYPKAEITVIDSHMATVSEGLLVTEAARMRKYGIGYDRCVEAIRKLLPTGRIFFSVGTMDYLVHGGRVGRLKGAAASTLGLKPILMFGRGELVSKGVARGKKKAAAKLLELAKAYFMQSGEDIRAYNVVLGYGGSREDCDALKRLAAQDSFFGHQTIAVHRIGAAIGVHVGPETVGIAFLKKSSRV